MFDYQSLFGGFFTNFSLSGLLLLILAFTGLTLGFWGGFRFGKCTIALSSRGRAVAVIVFGHFLWFIPSLFLKFFSLLGLFRSYTLTLLYFMIVFSGFILGLIMVREKVEKTT